MSKGLRNKRKVKLAKKRQEEAEKQWNRMERKRARTKKEYDGLPRFEYSAERSNRRDRPEKGFRREWSGFSETD